jgi:hypothetical protein
MSLGKLAIGREARGPHFTKLITTYAMMRTTPNFIRQALKRKLKFMSKLILNPFIALINPHPLCRVTSFLELSQAKLSNLTFCLASSTRRLVGATQRCRKKLTT